MRRIYNMKARESDITYLYLYQGTATLDLGFLRPASPFYCTDKIRMGISNLLSQCNGDQWDKRYTKSKNEIYSAHVPTGMF
jgi:hypothetical protein